jgi:predicted GNAT superfamily acetyltransferase
MNGNLTRPAALAYLNQWERTDKRLATILRSDAGPKELASAFRELATKYNVVRNFSTKEARKDGPKQVERLWGKVADTVSKVELDEEASPSKEVHRLARKLGGIFPLAEDDAKSQPVLLSAATKFLWFRGHTNIRIYDKRAVVALNALIKLRGEGKGKKVDGDYELFTAEWDTEYKRLRAEIKGAIKDLPQVVHWSTVSETNRKSALADSKNDWFCDRVFDKILWITGEKKSMP